MPLVVIHGHDGVERPAKCLVIERVVGEGTVDVEALGLHRLDGGPDDPDFLVAEEPVLAGMRVERGDGDARLRPPVRGRIARSARRIFEATALRGEQLEDLPQRDVQRHVDHAQAGPSSPS